MSGRLQHLHQFHLLSHLPGIISLQCWQLPIFMPQWFICSSQWHMHSLHELMLHMFGYHQQLHRLHQWAYPVQLCLRDEVPQPHLSQRYQLLQLPVPVPGVLLRLNMHQLQLHNVAV